MFDSSIQASQSLDSGKYVDSHVSQQCRPDSREEDRGSDERNEHVVVGDDINSRDKRIMRVNLRVMNIVVTKMLDWVDGNM